MSREYLDYEKRRLMTSYLLERAASAGKPITVAFTDESRAVIDKIGRASCRERVWYLV